MKIHLVGVGGVAMGNFAALLRELGHEVTGSDEKLYPPMSDRLASWGIEARPYSRENIGQADLYVIGNALSRGNPEVERILADGLDYTSMPEALYRFVLKGRQVIVVAGTHGKTTTTFLTHHLLSRASGQRAGLFAGGVRADGQDGFCLPQGSPYFVIEGDEYDTAFFDKHSKFLHYRPRFLILTSVEFDHADIFENEEQYRRSYARLLRTIPGNGLVVACSVDRGVRAVLKNYTAAPIVWYGREGAESSFLRDPAHFPLDGRHNRWNAQAALALGRHLGLPEAQLREGLRTFPGVKRRLQTRLQLPATAEAGPLLFLEDFAHHPTAVAETLRALRARHPGRRVVALFEPRSATSRRNVFQDDYARALRLAHAVYVSDIFEAKKIPAGSRLNVRALVKEISRQTEAHYAPTPTALAKRFAVNFRRSRRGDVVLAMSNGAFGGIYPKLEELLAVARAETKPDKTKPRKAARRVRRKTKRKT